MAEMEEREYRRRHGRHFLIPAGVLIGLGVGIIAGYVAAGLLIGLGLGFVATALLPFASKGPDEPKSQCCRYGNRWIQGIIGAFFVIVGAAIVWEPRNFWTYIWPYGVGTFFIFLGLVFIARMAWRSG